MLIREGAVGLGSLAADHVVGGAISEYKGCSIEWSKVSIGGEEDHSLAAEGHEKQAHPRTLDCRSCLR